MKKQIRKLLILIIVLALFNLIAFILPFFRTATFWCSYGFSIAAILIWGGVWLLSDWSNTTKKSRFYGWSLIYLVSVYMAMQVILGFVFMVLSGASVRVVAVIDTVLLCVCLIGLISTDAAKDSIETIDKTVKCKVFYIRSLENEVTRAANMCDDISTRKNMMAVADMLCYSDPMSDESLYPLEEEISHLCSQISELIRYQEIDRIQKICTQLLMMIDERNQKCKLLK